MAGKAKYIYLHFLYINGEHSCSLGSIHNKYDPFFSCQGSDRLRINIISRQVRAVGTDNHFCIRSNRIFDIRKIQCPFRITFHDRKPNALLFHFIERAQHGIVLQHCSYHMVSRIQDAFDRNIQALCRIRGKHDLPGIFRSKQPAQFLPGIIDQS